MCGWFKQGPPTTSFSFIKATFPDLDMNPRVMGRRLVLHLLRAARASVDLAECDDDTLHDTACQNRVEGVALTRGNHKRSDMRANRLYHRIRRGPVILDGPPGIGKTR